MSGRVRAVSTRTVRPIGPTSSGAPGWNDPSRHFGVRGAWLIAGTAVIFCLVIGGIAVAARVPDVGPTAVSRCSFGSMAGSGSYSLAPEQAQNAAIIAAVAFRMGLADHAVTVALATSMQESDLRNLPYGDLDSIGLFQQRPSQGWGTRSQILDPEYAASAFFNHLTQITAWRAMPVTEAAQLVQRSASPDAYAAWETEARSLPEFSPVRFQRDCPAAFRDSAELFPALPLSSMR